LEKSPYRIVREGRAWQVIFLPTGRSIGERYTRKQARELRARHHSLTVARRNREELDAHPAPRG